MDFTQGPQPSIPIAVSSQLTSTNVLLLSVQIAAANPNRKGWVIYNNSSNSCYITFGATSTSSGCTFILPTFTQWIWANPICYTGVLSCIRNAGSGAVNVYELT